MRTGGAGGMSDYVAKGAAISRDGKYRYRLWREWRGAGDLHCRVAGDERGACVFVMLNPSTADGETDDPTIRRCVNFAKAWKFERLEVLNLFAYRATDPKALLALNHDDDPVGPKNLEAFDFVIRSGSAGTIVCAWGAHGAHIGQDETALGWMGDRKRFALGLTKDGHPRHPLYLPANSRLTEFRP